VTRTVWGGKSQNTQKGQNPLEEKGRIRSFSSQKTHPLVSARSLHALGHRCKGAKKIKGKGFAAGPRIFSVGHPDRPAREGGEQQERG